MAYIVIANNSLIPTAAGLFQFPMCMAVECMRTLRSACADAEFTNSGTRYVLWYG